MNSGGGGAYTKGASKRKTSSLVLSKAGATPSGAGAVTINPRRNVRQIVLDFYHYRLCCTVTSDHNPTVRISIMTTRISTVHMIQGR